MATYKSPLHETVSTTPTDLWNDSCAVSELTYAIEHGAVGATTNPSIVLEVLKKEMHLWRDRIHQLVAQNPTWSEADVAWRLTEEMALKGAELLLPVFEREQGKKGRISIQTNPTLYRDAKALAEQAAHFAALAPNIQVKIPATQAGIAAVEEATYRGVSVNATVSFTVPQAIHVAEAVERGLARREREGKDTRRMAPVCTIMVGRLDDWLQVLVEREGLVVTPGSVHWAGVACFKTAYGLYQQRGYRTRLLAAAYRHQLHWTELVGGDIVLTITHAWQKRFNASGLSPIPRIHEPVPAAILEELSARFPDFRRACDEKGLALEALDSFGATRRTLRTFIKSYYDLLATVREFMLPDPDKVSA